MALLKLLKIFRSDDSGAVTIDWVVLTAALVGLGLVVLQTIDGGIVTLDRAFPEGQEAQVAGAKGAN